MGAEAEYIAYKIQCMAVDLMVPCGQLAIYNNRLELQCKWDIAKTTNHNTSSMGCGEYACEVVGAETEYIVCKLRRMAINTIYPSCIRTDLQ